jgi:hypothetical protein
MLAAKRIGGVCKFTEGPVGVDTSSDGRPPGGQPQAHGGRLGGITLIVIADMALPLAAYFVLRSAGLSTVDALLLSGVFPAAGAAMSAIRHRPPPEC